MYPTLAEEVPHVAGVLLQAVPEQLRKSKLPPEIPHAKVLQVVDVVR